MQDQKVNFGFSIMMESDYIRAESSGEETPDIMFSVYKQIIGKILEWDCDRVLYIEGFVNQIPVEDMMLVWRKIFGLVKQKNIGGRIAVFDRVTDDLSINTISESLAKAQGIDARVFNDLDEAISWLTH